jgi:hypothetical protein
MVPPEPPEAANPEQAEPKPEAGPPARRGNLRLIVAIGLAVGVLAGGGATIIALASDKRPEDSALRQSKAEARKVVEKFAVLFEQARNDGAFAVSKADVKSLLCAREHDGLDQEWQERENKEINRSYAPSPAVRLAMTTKDIQIEGDHGRATLTGTLKDRRTDQDFELVKEDAQWKVCGLIFRTPNSSSSRGGTSSMPGTPEPYNSESSSSKTTSPSETASSATSPSEPTP